jgi:hypothetical protein
MLGGLISFNLNPMSIFSYPIELGLAAGFINPRYGVDDIIAEVRYMTSTAEVVPVKLLPVPSISGPTIGTSFYLEYLEWARQIRRWIVGSSESFHYFVIHFSGRPLFGGLAWFFMFFIYYAVLLCSAGIFTLLAAVPLPWVPIQSYSILMTSTLSVSYSQMLLLALGIQYLVFAVAFIIDRCAVRLLTVHEEIHPLRNLSHWLLSPLTLLVYSLVAFYSIMAFVWKGKKMAKHDMAAKTGMVANTVVNGLEGERIYKEEERALKAEWNEEEEEEDELGQGSGARARASRSTSQSREASNSISSQRQGQERLLEGGRAMRKVEVACELPKRFFFGQFSESLTEIDEKKKGNTSEG